VEGREGMPCVNNKVGGGQRPGCLDGKVVRFEGRLIEGREEEWVSGLFVCRIRKIW
jgi:hypothetical protein